MSAATKFMGCALPGKPFSFKSGLDRNLNPKHTGNHKTGQAAKPAVHYLLGGSMRMRFFDPILILFICLILCGCMTHKTWESARGWPEIKYEPNDSAKTNNNQTVTLKDMHRVDVPTKKPEPAYYLLLPITVPLDIVLCPFEAMIYYGWVEESHQ